MKSQKKAVSLSTGITEKPLYAWDYLLFLLIAVICFLSFQQSDLMHTAGCSYGYLNGHILDFYDYCDLYDLHPSYMPSMYLMFAIWNIPMRLFGIVTYPTENLAVLPIMWAKLLPCLLYLMSGFVIYKICMEIGMGSKKSKICTFASLSMPIGFFSQFVFGQYDIFMLFCMLLGVYFYLKNKDFYFILWFGIAITFKYSSLLVFIPLLLLKTKNVWKIAGSCGLAAVPYVVEYLLYRGSETFSNYAFGIGSSGDNPTSYIENASYFTGFQLSQVQYSVSLTILVFGIICALAYFTRVKDKKSLVSWSLYLSGLVFFVLFGLAKWHPQWLLLAVPFWVMSAFIHRDTKIFMVIDLIFMLLYTMFNVTMLPGNVDQEMLNNGIFRSVVNSNIGTETTMAGLIGKLDPSMCLSMITMIILVYALFKHPKYCVEDYAAPVDSCMGWIRARFLIGMAVFLIPAFTCLFSYVTSPSASYQISQNTGGTMLPADGTEISQKFLSWGTEINQIQFPVIVNNQINEGILSVEVRESDTGKIIYTEDGLDTSKWYDGKLIQIYPEDLQVENNTYYEVVFRAEPKEQAKAEDINLALSVNNQFIQSDQKISASINGTEQDFQIQMGVYQQ